MSIVKQFSKTKSVCKVTFTLPSEVVNNAKNVALVGEFNDWNSTANLLKKQKDGQYKTSLELPLGAEFQFRYLLDGSEWLNDEAADKYVSNEFTTQNCVVVL
ncbi:isoamylase early set domain-containing protein [Emticicia fluvialis]|uniref:isoamylase early set domain-containing protein n=1 Tax=Emticicia fluvialis TaxID=2974474 RepID=UPI002165A46E|nr:isoamylase early set domain-containing protein [Emticicia fluvialis]